MSRYPSVVKLGSKNGDVKLLQEKLNENLKGEVTAFAATQYIPQGKVSSKTLMVRDAPSTSGNVIGQLSQGDVVQVISLNGLWTKIRYGSKKLVVTGIADDPTVMEIKNLQKKHGLVVDGVCGDKTWAKLLPECTYHRQNDPRWGSTPYTVTGDKKQTIASSGCGPTSMSMIVDTFATSMNPVEMCKIAIDGGFRTKNSGTSWSFFGAMAKRYGLKCKQTSKLSDVLEAIDRGALVVASMGVGYYTKGGHYIVIWSRNKYTKTIYTLDPASANRPSCSESLMSKESKQFFIIEK